jgi:hypothetical protein
MILFIDRTFEFSHGYVGGGVAEIHILTQNHKDINPSMQPHPPTPTHPHPHPHSNPRPHANQVEKIRKPNFKFYMYASSTAM